MKICFLTDDPFKFGGGPEHIRQVAHLLRQKYGYTVDVITPLQMNLQFNFFNILERIKYVLWTLKFLLVSDYDLYHSHSFSINFILPVVKLRGRKTATTIHGTGTNLIGGGLLNNIGLPKLFSWIILYVWPYDLRFSASHIKGFITVGNGVNISEFDKVSAKPNPRYFTVLCVSRNDPVKGLDILRKSIKTLQRKYSRIRLNLISGRRRTVGDFKTADLYVLPSLSEGLPIVLLEAMAAKLPIVATDVGDCRYLVEASKAGIIILPGDLETLTRAIIKMLQNSKRKTLGLNGYRFVKDKYTWEAVTQKIYEAYQ